MEQRDGIRKVYRPSYCFDNLTGEMRYILNPAQRSIYTDFLDMAKLCRPVGTICPEPGKPYTNEWLASLLNVPTELLIETIDLLVAKKKIENNGTGIKILGWEKLYQSEYERQKPYRGAKKQGAERFKTQKYAHMIASTKDDIDRIKEIRKKGEPE